MVEFPAGLCPVAAYAQELAEKQGQATQYEKYRTGLRHRGDHLQRRGPQRVWPVVKCDRISRAASKPLVQTEMRLAATRPERRRRPGRKSMVAGFLKTGRRIPVVQRL